MKITKLLLILFVLSFSKTKSQVYSASNFTMISNINPETNFNSSGTKYSGCWGWYQQSLNKEYAIACSQTGTYWIDITNPATPTVSAYKAGASTNTVWREVKTYQNYCYVVNDVNSSLGLQIFDMSTLPTTVSLVYQSQALFTNGHAAWIDGDKLYVSGVTYSNNATSTMNIYSLATPTAPVLIRTLNQDAPFITGVHDMYVRNDTVYISAGNQGLYVYKLNTNNTLSQLGSLTTYSASGYNHSSALTPNGQTLVFMDEVPSGLPIKVANVSNLANIQVLATTNQFTATTPHNPFMLNNQYCLASSYQEGTQLYDISNPSAPVLAGYFDTYPQGGGNTGNWGASAYKGQWGAYPFFPSKTIFALDMSNGIFLLKSHLYQNITTQIKNQSYTNSDVILFPNPAQNKLNFNLPVDLMNKNLSLQIFDAKGNLVISLSEKEIASSGNVYRSVDINGLSSGLYFFTLISEGQIQINKKFTISN